MKRNCMCAELTRTHRFFVWSTPHPATLTHHLSILHPYGLDISLRTKSQLVLLGGGPQGEAGFMTILVGDVSLKARWEKTWSKWCCDRPMVGNRRQIIRWQRTKEKCSWGKGSVSACLPVIIVLLVHCHPFLDEKVRRIDQSCRLTSQSRERAKGVGSCRGGPGPHPSRRAANQCRSRRHSAAWKSAVSTRL